MAHTGLLRLDRYRNLHAGQTLDQTWQGDEMSTDKSPHTTRLMFHNVNGLSIRGIEGFDMFAQEQAQVQVDIQGFSEHCLDTTKYQVYQTTQDILRTHFPGQSSLQLTSSTEPALNIYKPGGTGILLLGNLVSRQEPRGKGGDAMGRWSYLQLHNSRILPITKH